MLLADYFKLPNALKAIQAYEVEEQNYRKKLLSAEFTRQLKAETKLIGCNPSPECTITLKLKWSRATSTTVKEFELIIQNLFFDNSQYIHLCEAVEGCILATLCAPKPLMESLVKMAKTRLLYLLNIGVILLQIGDEIILDKREKKVYNEL